MDTPEDTVELENRPTFQFEELRIHGLLWLINTTVLHPRGFALALVYPDGATQDEILAHQVEPIGWTVYGDGTEAWRMSEKLTDECFPAVEALLASLRPA